MALKLYPRLKANVGLREVFAALNPLGPNVATYEQQFAEKFQNKYGTMFAHGRSGLYALFKVWGLDQDEIICPAYTCVVVPHAIVLSNNIPVFVDCPPDSFNMSYEGIERRISEKTRAIVVTHLFGYPMDVHRINALVAEAERKYGHKIYIIQDVAHSYGAAWEGELVTKYGDAAIFGSNVSKIITSIFGGMILTNDRGTDKQLKAYRQNNCRKDRWKPIKRILYLVAILVAFNHWIYGIVNWLERKGVLDAFTKYYEEDQINFPSDWDTLPTRIEARVGMVQLQKYDAIIEARRKNAQKWISLHHTADNIRFLPTLPGSTFSHCVALVEDRDIWEETFRKKGYQLGILIEYCVPYMKAYQNYKGLDEFPVSLSYSQQTINFPVWRGLKMKKEV